MQVSIIIRTANHARQLTDLLEAIKLQKLSDSTVEVILADANSTDGTLFLADFYHCRVVSVEHLADDPIKALNLACLEAQGDILVFLDPEMVPAGSKWLQSLIEPLIDQVAVYSYGRLEASKVTDFPRAQYLNNHFPKASQIPQYGSFAHNNNAAVLRSIWLAHRFDESLQALEAIQLVKELNQKGLGVAYVAEACVFDTKKEDFSLALNRYIQEGQALQSIYPDLHFTLVDFCIFWSTAVVSDIQQALRQGCLHANLYQILSGRLAEYWGAFLGHLGHREKSKTIKQTFLAPKKIKHKKI